MWHRHLTIWFLEMFPAQQFSGLVACIDETFLAFNEASKEASNESKDDLLVTSPIRLVPYCVRCQKHVIKEVIVFCCPVPMWFNHPNHREWADSGRRGFSGEPWDHFEGCFKLDHLKEQCNNGTFVFELMHRDGPWLDPVWRQNDLVLCNSLARDDIPYFFCDFNCKKTPAGWCSSLANLNWGMMWALTGLVQGEALLDHHIFGVTNTKAFQ